MEVCVKQGEIVDKHLKIEMCVGDVLCYALDEKLVRDSLESKSVACLTRCYSATSRKPFRASC